MSPENRSHKPTDGRLENSFMTKENLRKVSIEKFAKFITLPYGKTWCGAELKEKRHSSDFIATQVLALDIDNKPEQQNKILTVAEVINRCKDNGIEPTFIYSSFSHTNEYPRFRIVFVLDRKIENKEIAKLATDTLREFIFPEADSTTDSVRMWYGGQTILYENFKYLLPVDKVREIHVLNKLPSNGKNIGRAYNQAHKKWCKEGKSLYNTIGVSPKSTHLKCKFTYKVEKFDWDFAKEEFLLLKKFLEGTEKIWHNDLLLLASNMFRIKGGERLFKNAINQNPLIDNSKKRIMSYIKQRWKSDSPIYPISFQNIDSAKVEDRLFSQKYHNLLRVRPFHQYSKAKLIHPQSQSSSLTVGKARELLKEKFDASLKENSNKIFIFKCSTGLGKTSLAINKEGVAIFFPNHDLKEEKSQESKIDHLCSPRLPKSLPVALKIEYESLCKVGLYKQAHSRLKDFAELDCEDGSICQDLVTFLESTKDSLKSKNSVFSTHSKGSHLDFENLKTYIFDEDPLSDFIKIEKISLKDLRIIAHQLEKYDEGKQGAILIKKMVTHLNAGIDIFCNSISSIDFENPTLVSKVISSEKNNLSGDVTSFLLNKVPVTYIVRPESHKDPEGEKCILYVVKKELHESKKYIILSATANEFIYRKLYGDRIEFIDLSNVELKGKIKQFSNKSWSRKAMMNGERISCANRFKNHLPTITFLKFKDKIENAVKNIHFGKCEGFNELSGKDIKVIGTPHINENHYFLLSKFLGLNKSSVQTKFRNLKVKNNGYQFNFNTFEDEDLRKIQFHFIEKELIQAVGRARLLDNDCTVYLFSNYPLPHAEQYNLEEIEDLRVPEKVRKLSYKNIEKKKAS